MGKYEKYLTALFMAFAMGFFMSFFLTWINTGVNNGFIYRWIRSFGVSICVGFPVSLIISPMAIKLNKYLTENQDY